MTRRLFLLAALLGLPACSNFLAPASGEFTVNAIVTHSDLEGGFFYLKADNGVNYDPINLIEQYRVEGLRVRSKLKVRNDVASIHAFGTVVEVVEISRL